MTEIKMENVKSSMCQNDNTSSFAGVSSNSSFLGLTRESLGDKKIPAFAGMTERDGEKRRHLF